MTEFAKYSVNLYKDLQLNGNPVFNQTGSLEIAWTDDRLKDLKRKVGFSKSWGLNPTLITKEDANSFSDQVNEDNSNEQEKFCYHSSVNVGL